MSSDADITSQNPSIGQITQMARETFGTDEKAQRWLRRPTSALSGLSPLDVSLASANGVRKVVDLLRRIDHGLSV